MVQTTPVGPGGLPDARPQSFSEGYDAYQQGRDAVLSPLDALFDWLDPADPNQGLPNVPLPQDSEPLDPGVDVWDPASAVVNEVQKAYGSDSDSSADPSNSPVSEPGNVNFDDPANVSAHSSPLGQALEKLAKYWGAGR